ncbi:hypothetical protein B0A55_07490 [Friedmanniomyces simplex]|uniref:DOMON domain-containing protein n=1 Tax=Friedmanniomyces simplex TaxID=329884 RepID=A0A4U0XDN7_9PEZI|nr:hypothetical protein B0A55_07490 [Friedmanniomyces simplex]
MLPFTFNTILLFALYLLGLSTAADTTTSPPASVFTYTSSDGGDGYGNQSFVFALNVDQSTSDLYIHMSAPAGNSWMGVGFGSEMQNSFMFIAYASNNGTGVTLSPRVATGHSEPSYDKDVSCDLIWANDLLNGNEVTNGGGASTMNLNAVCYNATKWANGALNIGDNASKTQAMIFAVGPGDSHGPNLRSDDLSAGLERHDAYGSFTLDIPHATSKDSATAGVPRPNGGTNNSTYTLSGASASQPKADHDPAPAIHGFIMCLSFLIIFPLGALLLRVLQRVILHAIVQAVGLFLVCCATAGGIVISTQYNRSKNFASAHQIIGILLLLALLSQLGLGILHHRIFKKTQSPTLLGKIHLYLGPTILLFGIINAPIGFVFAGNPHLCLPYAILLLLIIIVYLSIRFGARICCRGRRKQQNGAAGGADGYQYPQFGPSGGQSQGPYSQPPPAYGRQPSYGPGDDVPLRPYESQHSGLAAPPAGVSAADGVGTGSVLYLA